MAGSRLGIFFSTFPSDSASGETDVTSHRLPSHVRLCFPFDTHSEDIIAYWLCGLRTPFSTQCGRRQAWHDPSHQPSYHQRSLSFPFSLCAVRGAGCTTHAGKPRLSPGLSSDVSCLTYPLPVSWFSQRRSAWADDGSNTESLTTPGNGCLLGWSRLWATPTSEGPSEKENSHPYAAGGDLGSSEGDERASEPCRRPSPGTIMRCQSADLPLPFEVCKGGGEDWRPSNSCTARATGRDEPASVLGQASLPSDSIGVGGCLHGGDGTTWLPGGKTTWSSSSSSSSRRRPRAACNRRLRRVVGYGTEPGEVASISARAVLPRQCAACSGGLTSVYNVQVSSDGRGILTASRDATVTLWDAQSRRVTYRFGHPRLSTRARPILWDEDSSAGGVGGLAGEEAGRGSGRRMVITGMKDGELRPWRVGSRFPNRVFKSARRHEGFEVTCLASSRDGSVFASADCGGNVCVQSATAFGVAERTVTR